MRLHQRRAAQRLDQEEATRREHETTSRCDKSDDTHRWRCEGFGIEVSGWHNCHAMWTDGWACGCCSRVQWELSEHKASDERHTSELCWVEFDVIQEKERKKVNVIANQLLKCIRDAHLPRNCAFPLVSREIWFKQKKKIRDEIQLQHETQENVCLFSTLSLVEFGLISS